MTFGDVGPSAVAPASIGDSGHHTNPSLPRVVDIQERHTPKPLRSRVCTTRAFKGTSRGAPNRNSQASTKGISARAPGRMRDTYRQRVSNLSIKDPGAGAPQGVTFERQDKFARSLVDEGFIFRSLTNNDKPAVSSLVRTHLTVPAGWTFPTDSLGIIVDDPRGGLAAAVVMQVMTIDDKTLVVVSHLVTAPEYRGRGLATVLLGMFDRVTSGAGASPPSMTVGFCAHNSIKLYRRAGFDVGVAHSNTQVPEGLPFPSMSTRNPDYPYPFYRGW